MKKIKLEDLLIGLWAVAIILVMVSGCASPTKRVDLKTLNPSEPIYIEMHKSYILVESLGEQLREVGAFCDKGISMNVMEHSTRKTYQICIESYRTKTMKQIEAEYRSNKECNNMSIRECLYLNGISWNPEGLPKLPKRKRKLNKVSDDNYGWIKIPCQSTSPLLCQWSTR